MVKQYKLCLDKTTATTPQQMVEEGFFKDLRTAEAAKRVYDGCVKGGARLLISHPSVLG